jgi:radical SAM superfamily enzyme YgiQ (UPF0313 family)
MQICLIAPKVNFSTNIIELDKFWYNPTTKQFRNLWSGVSCALLTIAALTPSEYGIDFIDENYEEIDFSKQYDLVGISCMTANALRAYEIADTFRKHGIKIVLGGIHPTLLPEEAKQHADSVAIGEAEYIWKNLLNDFQNNKLQPFYQSHQLVNLEDSPLPRFDLLKSENYFYIWMQTSRGCPHDCEYCASSKIFGKGYRRKNNDQIIKEIQFIIQHYKNKPIFFSDDNFLAQKKEIYSLLEKMTRLNIRWNAQCDISVGGDKKLLKALKKSGCNLLFIGLESVTENGLKFIDKNNWKYKQLKNYETYISSIQNEGIGVMGSFIVGLDSDDSTIFDQIINFIHKNQLYHAYFNILTPTPGTALHHRLQQEKRLLHFNWKDYTGFNVNYIPLNLSISELETGLTTLYKKTYSIERYFETMNHFKQIHKKILQEKNNF